MHADELISAVTKIAKLLKTADIRSAVDQYRTSKGEQRNVAAAKLGQAGALLVESIDGMSPKERIILKCLHLESLGTADYWQNLLAGNGDPKTHQAEIVRLASRVMFSSSHLPAIMSLMETVSPPAEAPSAERATSPLLMPVNDGEGALFIRLTDAGERASDPDRIARAIDGVDMLYSACASIGRKPAIDLRLDNVAAKLNRDRDFRFTGDKDSISAVFAVIDSIPGALAEIDPEQDIDLDSVVRSLPIFQDLNTLSTLGTFSGKDLKDISETMHQGALLTLESGVILIDEEMVESGVAPAFASGNVATHQEPAVNAAVNNNRAPMDQGSPVSAAESDEHYNRYLREREAMMKPQTAADNNTVGGQSPAKEPSVLQQVVSGKTDQTDQTRRDAVDELLKSLGQSRTT